MTASLIQVIRQRHRRMNSGNIKRMFFAGAVLLGFIALAIPAHAQISVTVDANQVRAVMPLEGLGMHTSVYSNQFGNALLDDRLIEAGIGALRYSGGGYADVYHWSVHKLTPWSDGVYGYIGPNTDFGKFSQLLTASNTQAVITVNYGSGLQWNAGHTQLIAPSTGASPKEAAAWVAYANGNPTDTTSIGVDNLGNDWKTVGYWANLRTLTAAPNPHNQYDFLAIAHDAPFGVKHWEIGNETFGTG